MPINPQNLIVLNRMVGFTCVLTMLAGLSGIVGWILDIRILKTVLPGLVAIKANTAVCLVLLGLSLWLKRSDHHKLASSVVSNLIASIVSIVGALSFLEYLGGWDFGIDQMLFTETAREAVGSVRPGLMSPITALCFVLLGLAVLLLDWTTREGVWPSQYLSGIAGTMALFTLLDLIARPHAFHAHIALQTVVTFCVFSCAAVCARPRRGILGAALASMREGGMRALWAAVISEKASWRVPLRYGIAVMLVFLATLLRHSPGHILPEGLVYITFYPAIMVAALIGGVGPGVLATLLSLISVDYFFLAPRGQLGNKSVPDLLGLILFLTGGIGASWLSGALDRARRHVAEDARRAKEEWELTFNSVPEAVMVLDNDFRIQRANRAMLELARVQTSEAMGRHCYDVVHAQTAPVAECPFRAMLESGVQAQTEITEARFGRIFDISATPLREGGKLRGCVHVIRDITERKQTEQKLLRVNRILQALSECTDALMRASDEQTMLQRLCDTAVGVGGYRMSWAGYVEHDAEQTVRPVAWAGVEQGYLQSANITWADRDRGRGPTGMSIRSGKAVVCRDIFADPTFVPWREEAARRGYRSLIGLPLRSEEQIFGALTVYAAEKDAFDEREQGLLEELANNVSYAVTAMRARIQSRISEEKLREASRYSRNLIETSLDPLVTISHEGKITDVNTATERATGIARENLIGSDFCDYFTDPEEARRGYQKVFADGSVRDFPLVIRHVSGRTMDVLYNASVFRNEAGEVQGIFAAARDITERKRAEDEARKLNRELEERVEQRTRQLRESEQRVRRKLESILTPEGDLGKLELADILDIPAVQAMAEDLYKLIPVPMGIIDLKGNFLVAVGLQEICTKFHRMNPGANRNCIESDVDLTQAVPPGEFRAYKCKNNMWDVVTPIFVGGQHLANLLIGQFFFTDEPPDYELFRTQAKKYGFDEQEYLAALDKAPRLTRDQLTATMSFLMKFAQLLSQLSYSGVKLARSMTQTNRVNAQLEASVKELEAFTYSVSHDLRAPLRHISGFSKILTEDFGSNLPPEAQHHLQRIQEGTGRMGALVDDLLNLARVGRRDLSMRITGLNSLVQEIISELKPELENRNIEWKVADLPYVECDAGLMKQVLQNLIANAVKFTRPRAQAVIEVGQHEENGVPVIFVRDNGVGFSMKYADKLFCVFPRLHRPEDFEGTGVGLATVQRIIQKHGGRIWAEAELQKGATFYFTLGSSENSEDQSKAAIAGEPK